MIYDKMFFEYLNASHSSNSAPHQHCPSGHTVRHTATLPGPRGHGTDSTRQAKES